MIDIFSPVIEIFSFSRSIMRRCFCILFFIPFFGSAQYFTIDSFTGESPYNKEFAFSFPDLKNRANQAAADVINSDMVSDVLQIELGHQQRSIFENIWGKKEMDLPAVSDISYKVINNDADFFCIRISATSCSADCESWTRYYIRESKSGNKILLGDLFTRDGLAWLQDTVRVLRNKKVQQYMDTLNYALANKPLSDDDKRDYKAAVDGYSKCMQAIHPYTVFSMDKQQLTIHTDRCLPYTLLFLDKAERNYLFDINTVINHLTDYGKSLLH